MAKILDLLPSRYASRPVRTEHCVCVCVSLVLVSPRICYAGYIIPALHCPSRALTREVINYISTTAPLDVKNDKIIHRTHTTDTLARTVGSTCVFFFCCLEPTLKPFGIILGHFRFPRLRSGTHIHTCEPSMCHIGNMTQMKLDMFL